MVTIRCLRCKEEDYGDMRGIVDRIKKEKHSENKFYRFKGKTYCYNCDGETEIIR